VVDDELLLDVPVVPLELDECPVLPLELDECPVDPLELDECPVDPLELDELAVEPELLELLADDTLPLEPLELADDAEDDEPSSQLPEFGWQRMPLMPFTQRASEGQSLSSEQGGKQKPPDAFGSSEHKPPGPQSEGWSQGAQSGATAPVVPEEPDDPVDAVVLEAVEPDAPVVSLELVCPSGSTLPSQPTSAMPRPATHANRRRSMTISRFSLIRPPIVWGRHEPGACRMRHVPMQDAPGAAPNYSWITASMLPMPSGTSWVASGSTCHRPSTWKMYRCSPRGSGTVASQMPSPAGCSGVAVADQRLKLPATETFCALPAMNTKRTGTRSELAATGAAAGAEEWRRPAQAPATNSNAAAAAAAGRESRTVHGARFGADCNPGGSFGVGSPESVRRSESWRWSSSFKAGWMWLSARNVARAEPSSSPSTYARTRS